MFNKKVFIVSNEIKSLGIEINKYVPGSKVIAPAV